MKKIRFSIVIPVAPERNAEILESLKKLDYPKEKHEIIVEKGKNPSDNRNRGVKKARGEIICFLDDDAYVERDFLNIAEDFFLKHKEIDIAGGPQLTPKEQAGFGKISGYALTSMFGSGGVRYRYCQGKTNFNADETFLTSANLFCRKEVFKKVQFNPQLFPGEDPDFIERARKENFKVAYCPEIFIYHKRRESFTALAKQIFNYGKTRPAKEKIAETIKRPFFIIPALFLIYLFLLFLLLDIKIISELLNGNFNISGIFFIPLIGYIFLNALISFMIAIREKEIRGFFLLPIIFLAIHLSYGAGIIAGIVKSKA